MAQNRIAWPLKADVLLELQIAGITPRSAITDAYYQQQIDAVVSKLQQLTKREFIPTAAGVVRYFDGSGTGEQYIDDFVDITDVALVGYLGQVSQSITFTYEPDVNLYPKNRIVVFQGSLPSMGRIWLPNFPDGRSNVKCTGTWGYSTYIPDAVWEAVRGMAAARLADLSLFNENGRLAKWFEADAGETRDINLPSQVNGWLGQWRDVIFSFRKPLQTHLRKLKPRMI